MTLIFTAITSSNEHMFLNFNVTHVTQHYKSIVKGWYKRTNAKISLIFKCCIMLKIITRKIFSREFMVGGTKMCGYKWNKVKVLLCQRNRHFFVMHNKDL